MTQIDIHRLNASKLFSVPYEEVTLKQRTVAKAWIWSARYSAGEIKLGQLVGQYPIKYEENNGHT